MAGAVHFVGIGGIGMSAIARVLLARGRSVSGSDRTPSPLLEQLSSEGARVTPEHAAENVVDAEMVVVSSAIDASNPEVRAAHDRGIRVVRRGEMLAALLRDRRAIAVCGTHGKTTTTAMLSTILRGSGIDAGLVLGGIDAATGTNAHDGTSPWFVSEADESDGSFALLSPQIAVVTNVENDHLASDDELPRLVEAFAEFLGRLPAGGAAVVGLDNAASASLALRLRACATRTFAIHGEADVRAHNVEFDGLTSRFEVVVDGSPCGRIALHVPGEINVANALAAIAVADRLNVPFERIATALQTFRGVRRRFEIVAQTPQLTVVDDYAHHPTAVRETISAARRYRSGPLVVAFQPHRYSRTAYLARDFAEALRGADVVYLAPIYAASEPALPGVSERSIGEPLRERGVDVRYASMDAIPERILRDSPPGSTVLMLGAGNITAYAHRLGERLESHV